MQNKNKQLLDQLSVSNENKKVYRNQIKDSDEEIYETRKILNELNQKKKMYTKLQSHLKELRDKANESLIELEKQMELKYKVEVKYFLKI